MRLSVGCGGNETPADAGQVGAVLVVRIRIYATHQVILLVGHDPWSGSLSAIPGRLVAEIGSLHGAVTVIAAVCLGVAVVKAAAGVVVMSVYHPVLAFGLVIDCGAVGIVPAQAHSGGDEDTIYLVSHDGYGCPVCHRNVVEAAHGMTAESSARGLLQVIALA